MRKLQQRRFLSLGAVVRKEEELVLGDSGSPRG